MAGDMTTPPSVNKPTLKTKDIIQKSFFYINSTKWGTMAVEHMNGREREREGGREGGAMRLESNCTGYSKMQSKHTTVPKWGNLSRGSTKHWRVRGRLRRGNRKE